MIVLSRFRVPASAAGAFRDHADAAVEVMTTKPGFLSADLGRCVDDPELWTVTTRWRDVGSYRRALGGFESKTVVVPLLARALDEPSAYVDPDDVGA